MELYWNVDPALSKHIVARQLLSRPLVLADVGVLGGEHPRWRFLGTALAVHGFDASQAAVRELRRHASPNRHYHWTALGAADDGERELHVNVDSPGGSTFIPVGPDRFSQRLPHYRSERVRMRSLDSLVTRGEIESPDFLKVDVEGFEIFVLRGAEACLDSSVVAVELETSFNVGPDYPHSHLGSLQELLIAKGFRLFDLSFDRQVCATYRDASQGSGRLLHDGAGRPTTFNVLFSREWGDRPPPSRDHLLKQMIVLESYGLVDAAFDLAVRFEGLLDGVLPLERVRHLLLASSRRLPRSSFSLEQELAALKQQVRRLSQDLGSVRSSRSWRLTAPMRAIRRPLAKLNAWARAAR